MWLKDKPWTSGKITTFLWRKKLKPRRCTFSMTTMPRKATWNALGCDLGTTWHSESNWTCIFLLEDDRGGKSGAMLSMCTTCRGNPKPHHNGGQHRPRRPDPQRNLRRSAPNLPKHSGTSSRKSKTSVILLISLTLAFAFPLESTHLYLHANTVTCSPLPQTTYQLVLFCHQKRGIANDTL